jgi:glycerophosphoryl diester phosphodiesterase
VESQGPVEGREPTVRRRTLVIAHRGFSGAAPENTVPAFEAAIDAGADMIELDVRLAAGGRPAVVHDDDLTRYGYPGRRVSRLTWSELEWLDAGRWFDTRFVGSQFLGLAAALITIGGRVPVNVEVKIDDGQESKVDTLIEAVLTAVTSAERVAGVASPPVLYSSFSLSALRSLRGAFTDASIALLHGQEGDPLRRLDELEDLGVEGLHLHHEAVHPDLVREVQARGLRIRVYTVNDFQTMHHCLSLGVDGIVTDWPDRLRRAQRSAGDRDRAGSS